jgi:hypothetical protein
MRTNIEYKRKDWEARPWPWTAAGGDGVITLFTLFTPLPEAE